MSLQEKTRLKHLVSHHKLELVTMLDGELCELSPQGKEVLEDLVVNAFADHLTQRENRLSTAFCATTFFSACHKLCGLSVGDYPAPREKRPVPMTLRYYRILADPRCSDRWLLASPRTVAGVAMDPRDFTGAKVWKQYEHLLLPLRQPGRMASFNFTDFDMPVVRREVAESIATLAPNAVQRLPIRIQTPALSVDRYEILNVLARLACLDETVSDILWWTAEDGRPDKIGEYRMVTDLRVNPTKLSNDAKIFRIAGWEIVLVVQEFVKQALERLDVTGIVFREV